MIKLFIVDDHKIVIEGIKARVTDGNIEVVGYAHKGEDVIKQVSKLKPDIVFIDLHLPDISGIEVYRRLSRKDKQIKAIFLTGTRDVPTLYRLFTTGAQGILLKSHNCDYSKVVKKVYTGVTYIQPEIAHQLIQYAISAKDLMQKLSPRQFEIILLKAQGLTNLEIANNLHISERRVSNVKNECISKLKLGNSEQLYQLILNTPNSLT